MKKVIIFSLIISTGFSVTSCNKKLDQQPIVSIIDTAYWKTRDDAKAANISLYAGLQNVFSNTFTEWGDARSDNLSYGGTGENQVNISLNGLDAVTASADWGGIYNEILRANLNIKYMPKIFNNRQISQSELNHYLAQAYTARAFMYFWAVRLWATQDSKDKYGVPVRLSPYETLDSNQYIKRTNSKYVFDSVILPDLKKALTLVDPSQKSTLFINQGAILSLLTEVYLWNKDYTNALATTNQIVALNRYSIVQDPSIYKDVFISATTTENIWSLDWHFATDGRNGLGTKLGSNGNTSNYYIDTSTAWYKKWIISPDTRRYLTYDTSIYNRTSQPKQIWKFYPIDINTGKPVIPTRIQCEAKLPFFRYADILLMQAEAANALGDTATALANVRTIRNRSSAGSINASAYNNLATPNDVLNVILDERQIELYCEGKRWFDLVRNGLVISIMDPLVKSRQNTLSLSPTGFSDYHKILWPVSRAVLIANTLIDQNENYAR